METDNYDRVLLEAVKARIPSGVNPVWFIMNVLSMGKEAVYRRLRGEVALTLKEAGLLANELGISLNEIINADPGRRFHYSIFPVDFETPGSEDYKVLDAYLDNIRQGSDDPFSQLAITANIFPQQLYLRYKSIARFAVFKWIYQNGERQAKAYHQVKIEERMQQIFRESREVHMQIQTSYYILDRQLCRSLVRDMKYFISIGLLREEDAETVREEARKLVDYMEQIAVNGKYENGNEVQMYVSDTQFNKAFYSLKAGHYHLSVIEACVLSSLASIEKNSYHKMNDWIHSRRRISTLISGIL